jgi:hypothetical protein
MKRVFLMKSRLFDSFLALQGSIRQKRSKIVSQDNDTEGSFLTGSAKIVETAIAKSPDQPNNSDEKGTIEKVSATVQSEIESTSKEKPNDAVENDDAEIITVQGLTCPTNPILESFISGKFSDVIVRFQTHEFRLHRVILLRSKYFNNILTDTTNEIRIDLNGSLQGLKLTLQELYDFDKFRSGITIDNVFQTLFWAIKFSCQDLCSFLFELISSHLYKFNFIK